MTFLSNIGAAHHWAQEGYDGPVPEAKLDHLQVADSSGYAQSKLLAEHLFAAASERLDLPVTICRLGQIAGPVNSTSGMWDPQEWFPSMLLSSKRMGRMPDSLATMDCVDWIPVDILADVLLNVIDGMKGQRSQPSLTFLHFVNPHSTNWHDLAPSIAKLLGEDVSLVSFSEWVEGLSAPIDQNDSNDNQDLPAAKLIGFWLQIRDCGSMRPRFSVGKSLKASEKLNHLRSVSFEWLERWWHQWSVVLEGE
jgi:thioester reductase-like protein